MRVVIIGAGNAGRQLAERLCEERHSVVMIDTDAGQLATAEANLDILTICGCGSSPAILAQAKVHKADLIISVSNNDEVNILSCLFANTVGVPQKIARVTNPDYLSDTNHYNLTAMGIDLVINQKEEAAREIRNALSQPGAVESFILYGGRVMTAGFRVTPDSPILNSTPATIPVQELIQRLRIVAIHRKEKLIIPHGDTTFKTDDCLYLVGAPDDIRAFSSWLTPGLAAFQKVIIAGGGDIGLRLAKMLVSSDMKVVLLEKDEERARICSGALNKTLILKADALTGSALDEAGIVEHTAFVAVTGDDENNVMNCLMARKKGVAFTIAQIARTDYLPVVESLNLVDRVISPYISTTHGILHHLRSRKIQAASLIHNLPGELLDVVISSDSKLVGQQIQQIKMPREAIITVVLRNEEVLTATGDLTLMPGDRLLIFTDPSAVRKIQSMFFK
jgi:trk system potassium uptake protein